MLSWRIASIADEDVNKGTDPISRRRLIENLDCYDFLNGLKAPNMVDSPLDSGHLRLTRLLNARRIGFRKSLTSGRRLVDVRQRNKVPKANQRSWERTFAFAGDKCFGVQEKRIDIPIVDNEEFRKNLIARIETVTLKITEQISAAQSLCTSYVGRRNTTADSQEQAVYPGRSTDSQDTSSGESSIDTIEERDTQENDDENLDERAVDFSARRSKNRLILLTIIMAEMRRLLLTNRTKTRRSFYYNLKNQTNKSLAPNQQYVDRAVNDIANLLECAPWDLRLLATTKGLVAGNMSITLADDRVIDCAIPGGALIPQIASNVTSIRTKATFVLVVEKDAVFQNLLEEKCPRELNCILVTGKGYPDTATRMLVRLLSEKLNLPVYILMDADPFGVDIMLIYRFGSTVLCKENECLACPNARWLGILPSELIPLGAKTIPLTEADVTKLKYMEARSYMNEAILKQLSVLRKGKTEIETVSSFSKNFLTTAYLPYKIKGGDYV